METEYRSLSPTVTQLTITIPADEIQKRLSKRYKELKKDLQIPGFRKGKAPLSVLKRRFGKALKTELTDEILQETVPGALEESALVPVKMPEFSELCMTEGKPFVIALEVEHYAQFELQDFKGLAPSAEPVVVTDKEIQDSLRAIQLKEAEATEVERATRVGDRVSGGFKLLVRGDPRTEEKQEKHSESFAIILGEDELFPASRMDRLLVGKTAEEPFHIEGELPLAYPDEALCGKHVELEVKLEMIEELQIPEMNEELAQKLFQKTLEELRSEIVSRIEAAKLQEQRARRIDVMLERLRENNPLSLPETLVKEQLEEQEKEWDRQEVLDTERVDLREKERDSIIKRLHNSLLLEEVAKIEGIEATDEDYQREFDRIGRLLASPDVVRNVYSSNKEMMARLERSIVIEKAIDSLLNLQKPLILEV